MSAIRVRTSPALAGTAMALAFSLLVVQAVTPAAFAGEKPWQDPDRVATSVEIDDDGIVVRTESRDGGDPKTIEIVPEESGTEAIVRVGRHCERGKRPVRTRVKWNLKDLDDLGCIDLSARDDAIVNFGEDIYIGRHERIDGDVVAVGGSIYVEGEVDGDVVAIGGSVTVRSGAEVDGDVVALAGDVMLDEDSEIDGDAVSIGGDIEDDGANVRGDTMRIGFNIW